MKDGAVDLMNQGILGVVLVAFTSAVVTVVVVLYRKLFGDEKGLLTQYVRDNREFLLAMGKRDEKQQALCELHANALGSMTTKFGDTEQVAEQTAASLNQLVNLHKDPDSLFSTKRTNGEIDKLKAAAIEGCRMCRSVASQWPEVADTVGQHCDAIEKIISTT